MQGAASDNDETSKVAENDADAAYILQLMTKLLLKQLVRVYLVLNSELDVFTSVDSVSLFRAVVFSFFLYFGPIAVLCFFLLDQWHRIWLLQSFVNGLMQWTGGDPS